MGALIGRVVLAKIASGSGTVGLPLYFQLAVAGSFGIHRSEASLHNSNKFKRIKGLAAGGEI